MKHSRSPCLGRRRPAPRGADLPLHRSGSVIPVDPEMLDTIAAGSALNVTQGDTTRFDPEIGFAAAVEFEEAVARPEVQRRLRLLLALLHGTSCANVRSVHDLDGLRSLVNALLR